MASPQAAGCIEGVLGAANCTLDEAEDATMFGELKGDRLTQDEVAFLMKYSSEDSEPALYADLNAKAYDKDRKKIMPYGPFIVGTLRAMRKIEPFGNLTVFRGVKLNLRADYVTGRKFTWHGFCSTTKTIDVLSNEMFCGPSPILSRARVGRILCVGRAALGT